VNIPEMMANVRWEECKHQRMLYKCTILNEGSEKYLELALVHIGVLGAYGHA
jgi:hypothetical protein